MSRSRRPRALRTRLLLAVVAGVGVGLVLLVAAFNIALGRSLDSDAEENAIARARGEVAGLLVRGGRIVIPEGPSATGIDTRVWIFQGARALRAPPVDPDLDAAALALTGAPESTRRVGDDALMHAIPVVEGGRRIGTVVAGISLAPYTRTRVIALTASIALGVVVLSAVAFAAALMLRAALLPVSRMTADAAAWSESDLDSRFAVGPPHDEITRLAATLDGLLDRIAAAMRRERRLTAEVSHELRTPLTQISAEVDLALRRERTPGEYRDALEAIRGAADRLGATIATLMATARQEALLPHGTGDAARAAGRVVGACRPIASGRGVSLEMEAGPAARAGVEEPVVERILQPVVENACRYATRRVRVRVSPKGREVIVEVVDDGPGVPDGEREAIFEPGVRGDPDGRAHEGAGLGLSLARRLARAAGGDVDAREATGGARFVVRLPSA